jgi:hypothetical protein
MGALGAPLSVISLAFERGYGGGPSSEHPRASRGISQALREATREALHGGTRTPLAVISLAFAGGCYEALHGAPRAPLALMNLASAETTAAGR